MTNSIKLSIRARQIMGQLDSRIDRLSRLDLQYYKTVLNSEYDRHEKQLFVLPQELQVTVKQEILSVLERYINVIDDALRQKSPESISHFSFNGLVQRLNRI